MSVFTGLTGNHSLAGIIGLSHYLLFGERAKTFADAAPSGPKNKDTPFFLGHGDMDPLVKPDWGKISADLLAGWGYKVDFKMYMYV